MIKEKIIETIKKYNLIENGDKIICGVSGGPDSITLLNILNDIRKERIYEFDIVVAHINHGLRENAIIDEKYVNEFCKNLNLECYSLHANVKEIAEKEKRGLEETGRKVRYDLSVSVGAGLPNNKAYRYNIVRQAYADKALSKKEYRNYLVKNLGLNIPNTPETAEEQQELGIYDENTLKDIQQEQQIQQNADVEGLTANGNPQTSYMKGV